jgi:hypothetical protein
MVESGRQDPGAGDDLGARFARLDAQIAKARRQLARLRHEGGRHFIDDQPVDPEIASVLAEIINKGDEFARLRAMRTGTTAVNEAFSKAELDVQHRQLDELESRIRRLEHLLGDDPHKHDRHFIDG